MRNADMKNRTLTFAAVMTAAMLLTAGSAHAAPLASWDFIGHRGNGGTQSGEPDNAVGLLLPGQVGPWATANGTGTGVFSAAGTSGPYTFTFNVGPTETISGWDAGGGSSLREDYSYISNPGRYSGTVPWRLEGLTPGTAYDLILFGRGTPTPDASKVVTATGHGAAILDLEGDANFWSVVADGSGEINGFFDTPIDTNAHITGVQFAASPAAAAPEPSTLGLSLLGLVGLLAFRRRRHR